MPTKIEKDAITGRETTGHEWDGIRELDTPLPSWWLWTFYATIAFSVVWMILYPSVPTLRGYFPGLLGFDQRVEVERKIAAAQARQSGTLERIASASLDEIRSDPQLFAFASVGGRAGFANNCAACHQAGGAGAKGYPSLADDEWLWGGSLDAIHATVLHGIRNTDENSRQSQMPRFGLDGLLKRNEIDDVAEYVLSLTGRSTVPAAAGRGEKLFVDNCAACHGDGGKGNREFGAPALNDAIWLYGGDKAAVAESISRSRAGAMPGWSGRLDPATVKMITVYVHALGGGE